MLKHRHLPQAETGAELKSAVCSVNLPCEEDRRYSVMPYVLRFASEN